jgi:uncharacterized protein
MSAVTIELLAKIKNQYCLSWHGTHGVIHWSRVYENGMRLVEQDGVNVKVLQLFSIFHDSRRRNESRDKNHGSRGAQLALTLREYCPLSDDEFVLLTTACTFHTSSRTHDDITVQACFDSDRLDLGRVEIMPDAKYLCSPMAKSEEVIRWAYKRSLVHQLPENAFGFLDYDDLT